ncbi:MAG: 23S rRNA pseudouridylate synthase [Waddliaceae bacterium]|nr:23S rRNA pseudouridylate synthase [Waddliaceae bacterium]
MSSPETNRFFVTEEEAGERLDKVLSKRYTEQSRTYFQYLITEKLVLVNGEPVRKRTALQTNDEVEVEFILSPELSLEPEDIPLDIVYEDEYLLAINKPAGLVVHPGAGNWSGTFANALLYHCKQVPDAGDQLRPGIVHRLDKDTSGLLLAAKTNMSQQALVELFSSRKIYKEYWAICLGNPGNGRIEAPIGRHPIHRKKMAVIESGRSASTIYETIAFNGKLSLVKLILETGRTHQIRVHMLHLGTPILGDETYGRKQMNQKYKINRQLLHAKHLELEHPITKKNLKLEASLPEDFSKITEQIH